MSRKNTTWTDEEIEALKEWWGDKTPDRIAKALGRSTYAVIQKAKALRLGPYLMASEYLGMHQVTEIMGIDSHVPVRTWIPKYNAPFVYRRIRGNLKFRVIRLEDLMKFLRDNPEAWDSRKVAPYALGTEPDWLREKRAADNNRPEKPTGTKYTAAEDSAILIGRTAGKGYKEIGAKIGRSAASVQARADRKRF
jgi:hypothetical protein